MNKDVCITTKLMEVIQITVGKRYVRQFSNEHESL